MRRKSPRANDSSMAARGATKAAVELLGFYLVFTDDGSPRTHLCLARATRSRDARGRPGLSATPDAKAPEDVATPPEPLRLDAPRFGDSQDSVSSRASPRRESTFACDEVASPCYFQYFSDIARGTGWPATTPSPRPAGPRARSCPRREQLLPGSAAAEPAERATHVPRWPESCW